MKKSSRRNFLFTTSGVFAGTLLSPGKIMAETQDTAEASPSSIFSQSGLVRGQKKPLKYQSIPGFLSAEQIKVHFEGHYDGALRGYTAADNKIQSSIINNEAMDANAYGALQRARTSKSNSVVLHELYFDGISSNPSEVNSALKRIIEKRFGTLDKWVADFKACAMSSSGWAILAFHPVNGKLYNIISDAHAAGVNWMATPLIVIDMYEHAYYIDYKNKKTDYIDNFLKHIDYQIVNQRLQLN